MNNQPTIDEILPALFDAPEIAIDTETTGVSASDDVFGISVSIREGGRIVSYYWDIRQEPNIVNALRDLFDEYRRPVIAYNIQFDALMLNKLGICIHKHNPIDAMVMAQIVKSDMFSYALDDVARFWLGEKKDDSMYEKLAAIFGGAAKRGTQMKNISKAPVEVVAPYAMKDTELTLKLYRRFLEEIDAQGLHQIWELEKRTTKMLCEVRIAGIRVDPERAARNMELLEPEIEQTKKKLKALVGKDINHNSPKQVKELFDFKQDRWGTWFVRDGDKWIETQTSKSGEPSLPSAVLAKMENKVAQLLVDLRAIDKARGTFLKRFIIDGHVNGRLYPMWNQCLETGRISIREPSLQNIPSKNKRVAQLVRECFLPEEGHVWIEGDLASNEVRIFAHLVANFNPQLAEEYKRNPNLDLHQFVADLTGLPRSPTRSGEANAKQLNLSAIFNMGAGTIAATMGLPWEWAEFTDERGRVVRYKKAGIETLRILERYHQAVPGVKEFQQKAQEIVKRFGFIRTEMGRKINLPKDKAYKATGIVIQSTAADINKATLLYAHNTVLPHYGGRLLVNIHDSYGFSLPAENAMQAFEEIAEEVNNPTTFDKLNAPLLLELSGVGYNWWQAYSGGNVLENKE